MEVNVFYLSGTDHVDFRFWLCRIKLGGMSDDAEFYPRPGQQLVDVETMIWLKTVLRPKQSTPVKVPAHVLSLLLLPQ